ncbi:MAG: cytochrome P450 [Actinomycetota bacterium]|nr:cytochrome P450 [Actinomycetota bacterium]
MPPLADGVGMPWDVENADPVAAIGAVRRDLGDEFVLDSGNDRYLFTFSPTGVDSFYALPEDQASKALADFRMLRRKLPDEVFLGRRTLPFQLFRRDDVAAYLANLEIALDATTEEMGTQGSVDLFALTRRLGHRMGLASWAGPGCADGTVFEELVTAFDALDGADAFVHPDAMRSVAASGKAAEQAALESIAAIIGEAAARMEGQAALRAQHTLFARIVGQWSDEDPQLRRRGAALDVALIHVASMSNLASALGWLLVDLVEHPDERAAVAAGDRSLAERCALESTRLAQRSIMARFVVAPLDFAASGSSYTVAPGVTIATLLPLLNTADVPGLASWDPTRWNRYRLADTSGLASDRLVTAFGHGRHSCPAQPFALSAMTSAAVRLFAAYDVRREWHTRPQPVAAQIGGVARSAQPCVASYRR